LLLSGVISEHFSKNRMIVVVAKIWYLKNARFLLGHPVETRKRNENLPPKVFQVL